PQILNKLFIRFLIVQIIVTLQGLNYYNTNITITKSLEIISINMVLKFLKMTLPDKSLEMLNCVTSFDGIVVKSYMRARKIPGSPRYSFTTCLYYIVCVFWYCSN